HLVLPQDRRPTLRRPRSPRTCDDGQMSGEDLDRPRAAELATPIVPVLVMLAIMWGSEIVDVVLDGSLDRFGIRPREVGGLDGIVLAPFLHGGFGHLIANTFSFLVLGGI